MLPPTPSTPRAPPRRAGRHPCRIVAGSLRAGERLRVFTVGPLLVLVRLIVVGPTVDGRIHGHGTVGVDGDGSVEIRERFQVLELLQIPLELPLRLAERAVGGEPGPGHLDGDAPPFRLGGPPVGLLMGLLVVDDTERAEALPKGPLGELA